MPAAVHRYAHSPSAFTRRTAGAALVLGDAIPEPIALRATSLAIWDAFEHPSSVGEVVDALAARFAGGVEAIRGDVVSLVDELVRAGVLVDVTGAPVR